MMNNIGISMLEKFPKEFGKSMGFCSGITVDGPIDRIVAAGMGGSSYPASICRTYLEDLQFDIPIEICRDFTLNKQITRQTLVFVSSYSGNTDEAIDCYLEALQKECQIAVITSGGRLLQLALKHRTPLARIINDPSTGPSVGTGYFVGIMLCILENSGLLKGAIKDLELVEAFLSGLKIREKARIVARKMTNKIPIIYTSVRFEESIARAVKIRLNEIAEIPAFCNVFPELTHSELLGYSQRQHDFHFVLIEDPNDASKVKVHMAAFEEVFIKRQKATVTKLVMHGDNTLEKIVGVIYLFEWISLYLAEIYGVDPFSPRITDDLKRFISSQGE